MPTLTGIRSVWKRAAVATLAVASAALGLVAQPAAALPFEGSFDSPTANNPYSTYTPTSGSPFGPWTVTSGSVNHGVGPAGTTCHNVQCVDLNGSSPGAIAQTFDTPEGGLCQVSFLMSRHIQLASATLIPSIDKVDYPSITHNTGPVTSGDGKWELRGFAFTANGPSTTLAFRTAISGAAGPQIDSVSVQCRETAVLKVCKVAGPTVPVGQGFSFRVNNGTPFSVPAGPGPGGYCVKAGRYPLGTNVTVVETAVTGTLVKSIGVVPANRRVGTPNLAARSAVVNVGSGVTEVTFTNTTGETGYIEVCKELRDPSMPKPPPVFHFDVPGVPGGVDVPAGACSPALLVPAGTITVTEQLGSGSALVQCSTVPSTRLVGCTPSTGKADVKVVGGGPSTQTIVNFVNVPRET